ncbi:tetratricopeptide repeat protein [Nitrincola sp. MINF-07-Sa-05]|uniref:tetratricopeptide repeat protein n=1 Tax=Nitrincola salilacus TaxID=3400273 RepID=UPI0039180A38
MRLLAILCLNVALLSGCANVQREQVAGVDVQDNSREGVEQEVRALFEQPFIDPLTRYLERYSTDRARAGFIRQISAERDKRCAVIAARYEEQPRTLESLERYRRGYDYSCSEDVEAFAALVQAATGSKTRAQEVASDTDSVPESLTDAQRNECYLLTKIRNFNEARELCIMPAESGDMRSQLNMALISQALRDYPEALRWARLVAERSPEARYVLGQLFANGQGVMQDYAEALTWFQRAANDGHAGSQAALGIMFLKGEGVAANPLTARQWLLKAARQNDGRAQYYLGEMSEMGVLAERDPMQALAWYDLSNRNGYRDARTKMESLSKQVDPEKFSQAQAQVRQVLSGGQQ